MYILRVCVMMTVLVGFAAADFACQLKNQGQGTCITPIGTLNCYAKGESPFKVSGGAFAPAAFVHMCLGDGGKTCADASNTADPSDPAKSCCSCYLYAKFCHGKSGIVTDGKSVSPNHDVLVMPAAPCTGVEYWGKGRCPGEEIWSSAFENIKSMPGYGMAINPVSRRGQHQMHIHLAQIHQAVLDNVHYGFKNFIKGNTDKFCLDCQGAHSLAQCTKAYAFPSSGNCNGRDPEVTIKSGKTAADVKPFETVYNDQNGQLNKAALVFRLRMSDKPNTWAIVTHIAGPAECFFTATSGKCG